MIKSFYIGKSVISANNISTLMYTKRSLWIGGVPFPSSNNAWQYLLTILDELQQLEVAEDIIYPQVLLAEKIGSKHKNMIMLLK